MNTKSLTHFYPRVNPNCMKCVHATIGKFDGFGTYSCKKRIILDLEYCWFFRPLGLIERKSKIKKQRLFKKR